MLIDNVTWELGHFLKQKTWPLRHGQKWCVSIRVQHLPHVQDEVCYDPLLMKAICFTDYFTILGSVTYLWITT